MKDSKPGESSYGSHASAIQKLSKLNHLFRDGEGKDEPEREYEKAVMRQTKWWTTRQMELKHNNDACGTSIK